MKTVLGLLAIFSISGTCLGGNKANLQIDGTISKVDISGDEAVISFKGVGHAYQGDPAFQNHILPIALYDTKIHLKLGFEGMHTYPKFRYLEWLKKEEAIALLKQFQNESVEVSIGIKLDSILYSKSRSGLRVSKIEGALGSIAEWKYMFKESISEFHKDSGVDYHTVIKAEQCGAEKPATGSEVKSKSKE